MSLKVSLKPEIPFPSISSKGLADNTVIAKVNGELWDLDRPFEKDATLQLLKFDDKDGKLEISSNYF